MYYLYSVNHTSFLSKTSMISFQVFLFLFTTTHCPFSFSICTFPHVGNSQTQRQAQTMVPSHWRALCCWNPSNQLVTLYYYDGYFIKCSLICHTPTTRFKKQHCQPNITPLKKMFLTKDSIYPSNTFGEITLLYQTFEWQV